MDNKTKQRISYVPQEDLDELMQAELHRCAREGTRCPEKSATAGLIEHHQYLPGTSASMAPGYESAEELQASKASPEYWAASKRD